MYKRQAYGATPNQFAADGYDCIYAIYEACQAAGITADMDHENICEKLIATFTDPSFSVEDVYKMCIRDRPLSAG